MTKNNKIASLFLIAGLALTSGCKAPSKGSDDEGMIEYDVSVVDSGNTIAIMAPSSMKLKFRHDVLAAEMKTGMSAVGIKFISDNNKNVFTQLVRILNQKYICSANAKNLKTIFRYSPEYRIKKTDEYKMIAGINCRKAEISDKNNGRHLFDVYFTDAFKFNKPNWWNEFSEIDGLLMEYNMKRFNIELHFIANKYEQVQVDSTEFNTKGDYLRISEDELNSYFDALK